jgi:hypothetical protein
MMKQGPRVYVQTRGTPRAADYAFLCGAPPHPWWRAYRDATAFDHPTVLVVSDGAAWTAYLSGVPSARTDAVGTVVRYTLVLDGPCGDEQVAALLPPAVAAWLADVAQGFGGTAGADGPPGRVGRLSAALDARFPADDVQRFIDADPQPPISPGSGPTVLSEPGRRVLDALATLAAPRPAADVPGDWIAAAGAPDARAAFVARVAALVGGAAGRALLLNLVGGPDDLASLRDPASPLAVLVDTVSVEAGNRALARPVALPPVVEAKKAPAAVARRTGTAAVATVATLPVLAVLVMAALVVTVLILML